MNTVSSVGSRWRFISAIWNSYSKSDTARRPRIRALARRRRAYSTSRPSKVSTSMFGYSLKTSRMMATRSSAENSGFFSAFTSTATMIRSKRWALRRMMSTWPFVSGSNDPGKIASRPWGGTPGISFSSGCGIRDPGSSVRIPDPRSLIPACVKRQRAVAGLHVADPAHRRRLSGLQAGRAFEHDETVARKTTGRRIECGAGVIDVVRRIQQDQIECVGGRQAVQRGDHVRAPDSIASLHAAGLKVLLDQRHRAPVVLDERHVRRAAAQGLDADGARAGKSVEHARRLDARREDVEQRLAQLVGCRSKALPRRRLQPAALVKACDHTHGFATTNGEPRRSRRTRRENNHPFVVIPPRSARTGPASAAARTAGARRTARPGPR